MKKFLLTFFVVFLGFAFVTAAEDLGALAKKEKARREAIAKEGKKAQTFTNADIPNLKSTLAIESTTPPETVQETTAATKPAGSSATEAAPTEEETTADRDAEIEKLKEEKEELEKQAKESRENVGRGGVFFTPNVGSQYQQAREAEEQAAEIDEKINKLEKEKEEEGEQKE